MNSAPAPAIIASGVDNFPANRTALRVALFTEDGTPVTAVQEVVAWGDVTGKPSTFAPSAHEHDGTEVVLTGYTTGSAGDLSATDTLNEALAKLEARIAALEP
jgi:hypothetical protein